VRELTHEELEYISGGDDETIVVTGTRYPPPYYPPPYYYPPPPPPYYGGGGGYYPPPPTTYPTCVETSPEGVSPADMLAAARAAAAEIEAANDENWEYGAFIYTLNGVVHRTPIHTDQSFDTINWSTNWLPDGARIVGMIHSHPNDGVMDQRMLSSQDWNAYNTLQNSTLPRGITMDANALHFLYSDQDSGLRAYDNTDKNQTSPSCKVN
jgi:hypothetical protein